MRMSFNTGAGRGFSYLHDPASTNNTGSSESTGMDIDTVAIASKASSSISSSTGLGDLRAMTNEAQDASTRSMQLEQSERTPARSTSSEDASTTLQSRSAAVTLQMSAPPPPCALETGIKQSNQQQDPTSFLSLPAELRNKIYLLALSVQPTPETDTPPLLLPFSPSDAKPPPIPVSGPLDLNNPRRYDFRLPAHEGAPYSETVETYRLQGKLHVPALLRTHPLIRAEASGLFYLHPDIVLEISSAKLIDFRRWARRVLSPFHRGMLFSNPGVTFKLLGHVPAADLDIVVDWLVEDVPAATMWRVELGCYCAGCGVGDYLLNKLTENISVLRNARKSEMGGFDEAMRRHCLLLRKLMMDFVELLDFVG